MKISIKQCKTCKQDFFKKENHSLKYWSTAKYCSRACACKGIKHTTNSGSFKKGVVGYWKDKKRPEVAKWKKGIKTNYVPRSAFKKGSTPWNKGEKGVMPIPWNKGKKNPYVTGEKNPNWKGGITPINQKIRQSIEYKEWRRHVFQRDNYTCQACGDNTGGNLNADHELPFALFPDLRFEVLNGRTLCVDCHKKTESYLNKAASERVHLMTAI